MGGGYIFDDDEVASRAEGCFVVEVLKESCDDGLLTNPEVLVAVLIAFGMEVVAQPPPCFDLLGQAFSESSAIEFELKSSRAPNVSSPSLSNSSCVGLLDRKWYFLLSR